MWFFYLFAFIPVVAGAILWVKDKEVTWWEWLAGAGIGFVLAITFHVTIATSMTSDIETWSGRVTQATFHPWWKERYTTTETYTTGSGKNRRTHTRIVVRYREHSEHWTCRTTLGFMMGCRISKSQFNDFSKKFDCAPVKTKAWKSGLVRGDPNIYVIRNKSGHVIPVTTTKRWTNRVQASPSVFKFAAVPEDAPVYDYPGNPSIWRSGRLLGTARAVDLYKWDQMNARLGPVKKVNVVMAGFEPGTDSFVGQQQEAKWLGGKKNDLVICVAGLAGQVPEWVYVFGWTEQEIVKRNLEMLLRDMPLEAGMIPVIEKEVRANYIIKDWDKFDYLSVEPPGWTYIVFILVMAGAQTGFYIFAHRNDARTKEGW